MAKVSIFYKKVGHLSIKKLVNVSICVSIPKLLLVFMIPTIQKQPLFNSWITL